MLCERSRNLDIFALWYDSRIFVTRVSATYGMTKTSSPGLMVTATASMAMVTSGDRFSYSDCNDARTTPPAQA